MESLASASLADNTHAAYSSACKSFLKFYASFTSSSPVFSLSHLPPSAASEPVLSAFAVSLSDRGLAASTIESYLAGIRTSFKLIWPEFHLFSWKDSRTKRVCEGIARSFPDRGRGRSNPLTLAIIRRAVTLLQSGHQFSFPFTSSRKQEFICIILWLFITGSRASELLDSASNRGLHYEEIRFVDEASGATHPFSSLRWEGPAVLLIGRSKTDQRSEGLVKSVPNVQSDLCPMFWARNYFESLQALGPRQELGQSRLFFTLDYNAFSNIFREVMASLGEDDCTPHGTKSGASTQLASLGVEDEAISRQLMWKSKSAKSMVSHYSHRSLQESLRLQRAMLTEASPILLKPLRTAFQL